MERPIHVERDGMSHLCLIQTKPVIFFLTAELGSNSSSQPVSRRAKASFSSRKAFSSVFCSVINVKMPFSSIKNCHGSIPASLSSSTYDHTPTVLSSSSSVAFKDSMLLLLPVFITAKKKLVQQQPCNQMD